MLDMTSSVFYSICQNNALHPLYEVCFVIIFVYYHAIKEISHALSFQ